MKTTKLPFPVEVPEDLWGRVRLACALRGKAASRVLNEAGYKNYHMITILELENALPSGGKLEKLAEILDIPLEWYLEGVEVTRAMKKYEREQKKAIRQAAMKAAMEARHE